MPVKKFILGLKPTILEAIANPNFLNGQLSTLRDDLQTILSDEHFWEISATEPQGPHDCLSSILYYEFDFVDNTDQARCYYFQNCIYLIKGSYTEEQDKLLVQESFDTERQKFERLKKKFSGVESREIKSSRVQIPEDVRIAVWRRDGGACAKCSSRERLEYDHIVPVSRGGSNTVRNIELLCEVCNRSKSNHIQ